MSVQSYQENLLRYANSKHATVTSFECSTPKGSKTFSLFLLDRLVFSTEPEEIFVPENTVVISYRESGAAVVRREDESLPLLVSPSTAAYYSPGRYVVRPSAGRHKVLLLSAHLPENSVISEHLKVLGFEASVKGFGTDFSEKISDLASSIRTAEGPNYFGVAGTFFQTMHILSQERYSVDFGRIPEGLPAAFHDICEKVRLDPRSNWSIESACKLVGYSPQYFSRAFKHAAGEGFHTFVQRVRLSRAANMICSGETRFSVVLEHSGFASQQTMRETFRLELGLLPSDFKPVGESARSTLIA